MVSAPVTAWSRPALPATTGSANTGIEGIPCRERGHINGIESFRYAKRRHARFNGLRRSSFPTILKEVEFRFNTGDQDLCKILPESCRMKPLSR